MITRVSGIEFGSGVLETLHAIRNLCMDTLFAGVESWNKPVYKPLWICYFGKSS